MNILDALLGTNRGDKAIATVAIEIKEESIVKLVFGGIVLIVVGLIAYAVSRRL